MLLNSLFGRFGMSITKPITRIVKSNKLNKLLLTREILSESPITDVETLVVYYTEPNKTICEEFGLNIADVLNKETKLVAYRLFIILKRLV